VRAGRGLPTGRALVLVWPPYRRDTARAMSQENVEVVRTAFEAWNAGDMDALRELYDPDAINKARRAGPSRSRL
jgi:predicted lipid-binding transport protein (Tim44 family)